MVVGNFRRTENNRTEKQPKAKPEEKVTLPSEVRRAEQGPDTDAELYKEVLQHPEYFQQELVERALEAAELDEI